MNLELLTTPSLNFMWKDRRDNFYNPSDMETRHLFMTLVMIWNSTMPVDARILRSGSWRHHMYRFGPHYTADYLAGAIGHLARELFKRTDMEFSWRITLNKMHEYLYTKHNVRLLNDQT